MNICKTLNRIFTIYLYKSNLLIHNKDKTSETSWVSFQKWKTGLTFENLAMYFNMGTDSIEGKNHMITSIGSEKTFNKLQKQILIKCLKKLGVEDNVHSRIKVICKNPPAHNILNGESMNAFHPKFKNKAKMSSLEHHALNSKLFHKSKNIWSRIQTLFGHLGDSVKLLPSVQVMILGSWNLAPHCIRFPDQCGVCFFLSLSTPSPSLCSLSFSLSSE